MLGMNDLSKKSVEPKAFVEQYGRELDHCQEVHFRYNASGEVYDDKSTSINKALVLKVQEIFSFDNWEIEPCTGIVHALGRAMGFDPIIYMVADHNTSKHELLGGKRTWVYPPTGAMLKLDPF